MSVELKQYEEKMNKTLDSLSGEYTTIRAGRANPHVLIITEHSPICRQSLTFPYRRHAPWLFSHGRQA